MEQRSKKYDRSFEEDSFILSLKLYSIQVQTIKIEIIISGLIFTMLQCYSIPFLIFCICINRLFSICCFQCHCRGYLYIYNIVTQSTRSFTLYTLTFWKNNRTFWKHYNHKNSYINESKWAVFLRIDYVYLPSIVLSNFVVLPFYFILRLRSQINWYVGESRRHTARLSIRNPSGAGVPNIRWITIFVTAVKCQSW